MGQRIYRTENGRKPFFVIKNPPNLVGSYVVIELTGWTLLGDCRSSLYPCHIRLPEGTLEVRRRS